MQNINSSSQDSATTATTATSATSSTHTTRWPVSAHRLSMNFAVFFLLLLTGSLHGTPDYCSLVPEIGFCRGYFTRYYYNTNTGECKKFGWGGCGGNANRFRTMARCKRTCKSQRTPKDTEDM
ncbi:hypothetical protein C0Q70_09922 [Pomacea canaliculata]|uniref:BPTI/Kunitz inhibitor domain-containing protein n=1 Tax=Pomacea canaliculata TaxID=400727 RepID=A0A2T7PB61_POMCA|nr:hypothetical protein C0Q70_09922 [Pomacea canaliculata]